MCCGSAAAASSRLSMDRPSHAANKPLRARITCQDLFLLQIIQAVSFHLTKSETSWKDLPTQTDFKTESKTLMMFICRFELWKQSNLFHFLLRSKKKSINFQDQSSKMFKCRDQTTGIQNQLSSSLKWQMHCNKKSVIRRNVLVNVSLHAETSGPGAEITFLNFQTSQNLTKRGCVYCFIFTILLNPSPPISDFKAPAWISSKFLKQEQKLTRNQVELSQCAGRFSSCLPIWHIFINILQHIQKTSNNQRPELKSLISKFYKWFQKTVLQSKSFSLKESVKTLQSNASKWDLQQKQSKEISIAHLQLIESLQRCLIILQDPAFSCSLDHISLHLLTNPGGQDIYHLSTSPTGLHSAASYPFTSSVQTCREEEEEREASLTYDETGSRGGGQQRPVGRKHLGVYIYEGSDMDMELLFMEMQDPQTNRPASSWNIIIPCQLHPVNQASLRRSLMSF